MREGLALEIAEFFGREELEKLDLNTIVRDGSTRSIAQGVTPYMRAVLSRMKLVVSVSLGRLAPFVVGDIGSLKCIPSGKNLLDPGSEYFMPMSSDTCVSVVPGSGVLFNPILDRSAVRRMNEGMFYMSREVACRDRSVLESLMKAHKKGTLYLQKDSQQN